MRSSRIKADRRLRRKRGLRKRVRGTTERPRLTVFRSAKHIYAQIVDDDRGVTLCEASTLSPELHGKLQQSGNIEAAKIVGAAVAKRAKANDIKRVCFDRNGFRFHGRIKGLAEAARGEGLLF